MGYTLIYYIYKSNANNDFANEPMDTVSVIMNEQFNEHV